MSHALSPVTIQDVPAIVEAKPFEISALSRAVLWVLLLVGVAAFAIGVMGADPMRYWTVFHINFTYWFILSAAASCFTAVFHICNAQWARPIRRLFESASVFFTFSVIPLAVLYFGRHYLFLWANEPIPGKELWLSSNFLFARDLVAALVLILVARRAVFLSVSRDIGAIRGGLTGVKGDKLNRWSDKSYDTFVAGWGPDARMGIRETKNKLGRLSPVIVMIYAISVSLIAFDQVMSVDPHWYSTLFGAFVFMSGVYLAMAWTSMGVGYARVIHPLFLAKIHKSTLWDLGKLLFGFGIFWAYLFWSHYLTIWYANLPEETGWLITRLRLEPWHRFAWVILGCCFILPFLIGLSRDAKQVPRLLFATGVIVAVGLWLQSMILFAPTLYPTQINLGLPELFVTLGFIGAYLLCAASFLKKVPLIPFGDFYE